MTNAEIPAENTGGNTATSTTGKLAELPARVRVHALAKLLGSNSRELLWTLTELGESARSAQSSVSRDVALRVAEALGLTDEQRAAASAVPEVAEPAVEQQRVEAPPVEPVRRRKAHVPVFAAPSPIFLPPEPAAAPVRKQQPEPVEELDEEPQGVGQGEDDGDDSGRRRRRRGRRGRGLGSLLLFLRACRGEPNQGDDCRGSGDGRNATSRTTCRHHFPICPPTCCGTAASAVRRWKPYPMSEPFPR
jgi:ribonuclease E